MTVYLKFAGCVLLFGLWTALIITGHENADLIDAIKYALGALGFYHAIANLQSTNLQQIQSSSAGPVTSEQKLPTVSLKDAQ
jgi:hypothetical protein